MIYKFTECAPDAVTCSDYTDYATCYSSGACYFCQNENTCIDNCNSCVGYNRTDQATRNCTEAECEDASGCPDGGYGYTCDDGTCNLRPCPDGKISDWSFDACFCNDNRYSPVTANGYCCGNSYREVPCESYNVYGYIKNEETGAGIIGATISVVEIGTRREVVSDTTTEPDGFYNGLIGIASGDYEIVVTASGYYTKTILTKTINQNMRLDVNLTPKDITGCDGINPPAVNELLVSIVVGEPKLLLNWNAPDCDNIDGYYIYRNDTFGNYVYTVLPADIGAQGDARLYLDDGGLLGSLEWGKDYKYKIRVHYKTGITSLETPQLGDKYIGEDLCEYVENQTSVGKYDIEYVCEGNNRYQCTNNLLSGDSCESAICITNLDHCITPSLDFTGGNPFGLFSTTANCDDSNPYQFLDYSSTSIDKCNACSQTSSCFDYKSQYACLADSCYASVAYTFNGTNTGCAWQPTYYSEFGKGFCYDADYEGEDNCILCNEQGNLFGNSDCTSQQCRNLGNCINVSGSCNACSSDLRCEAITSELECTNSKPFSVVYDNGFPLLMDFSDDSCNVGRCVWENDACYKKADGINYCSTEACRLDITAPITSINRTMHKIHLPISWGGWTEEEKLKFTLDLTQSGNLWYNFTYALKARDGSHILSSEKTFDEVITKNILTNSIINASITESGVYEIFYYSKDDYFNLEEPNKIYTYIDNEIPFEGSLQSVKYSTKSNDQDAALTDITLLINSEEYLACMYNLTIGLEPVNVIANQVSDYGFLNKSDFENVTEESFFASSSEVSDYFSLNIEKLPDEEYTIRITCRDNAMNMNTKLEGVGADQIHEIESAGPPKDDRLMDIRSSTILFAYTSDPAECRLYNISGPAGFIFASGENNYIEMMTSDTGLYHSLRFFNVADNVGVNELIPDGDYLFNIGCQIMDTVDYAEVGFIVDTTFGIISYSPTGYTSIHQPTITLETDFSANCTINEIKYKEINGPTFQVLSFVPGGVITPTTSKMDSIDGGLTHTKQVGIASGDTLLDLIDQNYFVVNASCESIGAETTIDEVEFSFITWYQGPNVGDIRIT